MKLFLASEAKNPATIEKLRKYTGGFDGKSIVYIPTAANGENEFGDWKENSGTWKLVQNLGAEVKAVQLEDYKDEGVLEAIGNPDILWVAGGTVGYLMYWIVRTKLDIYIPKILNSGTLYVGSSAGSWAASKSLSIAPWFIGEEERGGDRFEGLGLVDFDIYPHYEDHLYDQIVEKYKGNKLYLLKNGEEVLVEDGKVTVQGEERIIT